MMFKRKLIREIDKAVPALSAEILKEPIPEPPEGRETPRRNDPFLSVIRRPGVIAACLAVLMAVIAIFPIMRALTPAADGRSVITVEVNPAVTFVSDESGAVTTVTAVNADADVILAAEGFVDGVIGKSTAEAVAAFVDMTARLGYMDTSAAAVRISTYDGASNKETVEKVKSDLEEHMMAKGILGVVVDELMDTESFEELNGIKDDTEDIFSRLESAATLYSERALEGLGPDEIRSRYEESLDTEKIKQAAVELFSDSLLGVDIGALLEGVSGSELVKRLKPLLELLGSQESIPDELAGIMDAPDTVEEYMKKSSESLKREYERRLEENQKAGEETKNPISREERDEYLENITKEYGSLEEYFKEKHEKSKDPATKHDR